MGRKRKSENSSQSDSQKPKSVRSVRAKSNMATPNTPVTTGTAGNGARNTGMSPTKVVKGAINTGVQFSNQGVKVARDTFFLQSTSTRSSL